MSALVISCGDGVKAFEVVKEAFDMVSLRVFEGRAIFDTFALDVQESQVSCHDSERPCENV